MDYKKILQIKKPIFQDLTPYPLVCLDKRSMVLSAGFPFLALALLNGFYLEYLYRISPVWFWLADGIQFLLIPGLIVFFLVKAGSVFPSDYGFKSFGSEASAIKLTGLCLLMCVIFWLVYFPLIHTAYYFWESSAGKFGYRLLIPESPGAKTGVIFYLAASAAFAEEMVFRGLPWLYCSLIQSKRKPVLVYIVSTSILFSAIHWEQGLHGMVGTLVFGVTAAIAYVKIRNLWPLVVGHFFTNVISFW